MMKKNTSKSGRGHAFFGALSVFCLSVCVLAGCSSVRRKDLEQPLWHLLSAQQTQQGVEVEIGAENLLLKKGVRITADSQESEDFRAQLAADGISDEDDLRWSSENDWEDNEHWLQADFGKETQIGYVKLFWERTNACSYSLEYSQDAKEWSTAAAFYEAPAQKEQNICLDSPVTARYVRLHVTDVTKEEADLSLYYQNVSLLEMEVYAEVTDRFVVEAPVIESGHGRVLSLPKVPQGFEIAFGGADYENLITPDGRIADTLSKVCAEAGFVLKKEAYSWELPGMAVVIPESMDTDTAANAGQSAAAADAQGAAAASTALSVDAEGMAPAGAAEWKAAGNAMTLTDTVTLVTAREQLNMLSDTAELFLQELQDSQLFSQVLAETGSPEAAGAGQSAAVSGTGKNAAAEPAAAGTLICLQLADSAGNSLGEEGFARCAKQGQITVLANTVQGIRWGCVTLLDWMKQAADKSSMVLAAGTLRDYPKYPVRGFGIDVGRRAIPIEFLYELVQALSQQKMNTLQVHLNDNQIIAQSEYDGTVEGARALYAGFRLESDIRNGDGVGITSTDLYYSKEAFKELIKTAAAYGVEIVPEIDTPAHSLALTKVFPELGFSKDPESIDQLDLSKKTARQLGMAVWKEYLTADSADGDSVFADCSALHLGMDEYYGKSSAYVEYLQELSAYVNQLAPQKELRIWGSLSKMDADYSQVSRQLQMHIWDTDWTDPQDMYGEGFGIINSLSSSLYIIPGGGYDWMDTAFLEKEWQPNLFLTAQRNWELPAWSDRMLGAVYMMWNDWHWANGDEITEESLYERFAAPLPILAQKLWGKAISFSE